MKDKKLKLGVLLVAILVISFVAVYFYLQSGGKSTVSAEGRKTSPFVLMGPVFGESLDSETSFLDEEAGISLYLNINQSIDLAVIKPVYRTIEKETANYTIGSVGLPGLPENEDVHCFVHKDGWIVTYYLKGEPISKIVDWNKWSRAESALSQNNLEIGTKRMTDALGVPMAGVKYYHFQYPSANRLMLIIDALLGQGADSFNVTIPLGLTVYERSWSHYAEDTTNMGYAYNSYFKIDGSTINVISNVNYPVTQRGELTIGQLPPDAHHIVSVDSSEPGTTYLYGVCLALAYQEP